MAATRPRRPPTIRASTRCCSPTRRARTPAAGSTRASSRTSARRSTPGSAARRPGGGCPAPRSSFDVSALNDPALVRREYEDDSGLAVRIAAQQASTGPDPRQVALDAVAEAEPQLILEVG